MTKPIGLIAGWGRFPVVFAEKAHRMGIPVVCVGIRGMASKADLVPYVAKFYWTRLAAINTPIRRFKQEGVERWTMAGKVFKTSMFAPWRLVTLLPDWRTVRWWYFQKRRNNNDDTLLTGMIAEFARDGLICESALELCPEILVKAGVLTHRVPTLAEEEDIAYGWRVAKEMGRLDIGQSVMICEKTVIAVEAIEGTDQAIQRAGQLCRKRGFVVVKVAKPNQDMRFDVPTVGTSTIETLYQSGGRVLAIEANKTIFLDPDQAVALANRYGITITAIQE